MEESELQAVLEREKWMESERAMRDVCGEFPYCRCCDKGDAYPCAAAYRRHYAGRYAPRGKANRKACRICAENLGKKD